MPGTFTESAKAAVRNAICTYARRVDNANSWLQGVVGPGAPAVPLAREIRATACGDPFVDETGVAPPFLGGQCSGTRYRFDYEAESRFNPPGCGDRVISGGGTLADSNFEIWGPVSNVRLEGEFQSCGLTMFSRIEADYFTPEGVPRSGRLNFSDLRIVNLTSLIFTRIDGNPDVCGDPPPEFPPFPVEGVTINIDFDYVNEEGNTINQEGDLILFAPIVGSFNSLFAPIKLDFGGFTLDGTVELAPEFNITFNPSSVDDGVGTPTGDPLPLPDPDDDPQDPEDRDDSTIIGVQIRAETTGGERASAIFADPGPTIYAPRLGTVSFRVAIGTTSGFTNDIPIKNRNCYIPCPEPRGARGVRVSFEEGVTGEYSLVRGKPLT